MRKDIEKVSDSSELEARSLRRLAREAQATVGYISKKCHIPNFENQERASQILMIHHNLTKGAV